MRINHNIAALNTYRSLTSNNAMGAKSLEKLSSGLRINRAGDDAAGLAISEKMRGQIRGLDQGSRNAQDTISLLQTAEGALNETHSILQRMRELATQSSNDTNTDADRTAIQNEINQLANEIDRIGNTTEFNTRKLLDGTIVGVSGEIKGTFNINNNSSVTNIAVTAAGASHISNLSVVNGAITVTRVNEAGSAIGNYVVYDALGVQMTTGVTAAAGGFTFASGRIASGRAVSITGTFHANMKAGESFTIVLNRREAATTDITRSITAQIGANSGQTMLIGVRDMRSAALGVKSSAGVAIRVDNKYAANTAISTINNAVERVSSERSKLGSIQNRLDHTINNLGTSAENLQASESRIRDVDMAKEMMEFTKQSILQQAAQAMLAQANQSPQGVLQLLR